MPAGYLVKQEIVNRITNGLVKNADLENCIAPASYLLRVGGYLDSANNQAVRLETGEAVIIQPRAFLLIGTIEEIKLPNDIIGFLHLRSSYARRGLLPWSQGIVEPGYSGSITIVAHNHSGEYLAIVGGERICHLLLSTTNASTELPYGSQEQTDVYQGSTVATASKEGSRVKVAGQVADVVGQGIGGFAKSIFNF